MEKEIKEIIEKNMPAQVGDVLKQRLQQAETDAINLKIAKKTNEEDLGKIRELVKQLDDYGRLDHRNKLLEAREKIVNEAERNLKIATLEFQLEAEKDKTKFSKEVAIGLVRNIEYRKNVFDNESRPGYYDAENRWVNPITNTNTANETKSAT